MDTHIRNYINGILRKSIVNYSSFYAYFYEIYNVVYSYIL